MRKFFTFIALGTALAGCGSRPAATPERIQTERLEGVDLKGHHSEHHSEGIRATGEPRRNGDRGPRTLFIVDGEGTATFVAIHRDGQWTDFDRAELSARELSELIQQAPEYVGPRGETGRLTSPAMQADCRSITVKYSGPAEAYELLLVGATHTLEPRPVQERAVTEKHRALVGELLRARGLVEGPGDAKAWAVDLEGDGAAETILEARAKKMSTQGPLGEAGEYSFVAVLPAQGTRLEELDGYFCDGKGCEFTDASFKGALDLDGDGTLELYLMRHHVEGQELALQSYAQHKLSNRFAAFLGGEYSCE